MLSEIASISIPTSYKLISDLENLNVVKEKPVDKEGRVYAFDNYLKLFRSSPGGNRAFCPALSSG